MKQFTTLIALLLISILGFSQQYEEPKSISKKITLHKQLGETFDDLDIFSRSNQSLRDRSDIQQAVSEGTILSLDTKKIQEHFSGSTDNITLNIPAENNNSFELELIPVSPFSEGFLVTTDESNGEAIAVESGLHYRGIVKADPYSMVAISIYPEEVMGLIVTDNGNFVIGRLEGKNEANDHILYQDNDLKASPDFGCETLDDGRVYKSSELDFKENGRAQGKCVNIYVEVNKDIYNKKGSVQNTVNFVTGIFNQSAILFANDNITISLSQVFVHKSGKAYKAAGSTKMLSDFQKKRKSFNGDLAELISFTNNGGIAAGFDGLCNSDSKKSMCYSGIQNAFQNVPTYSWSVFVFTHELGHLMGSRHTHACVWNGNATGIDGCAGTMEGGCSNPGNPSGGGTIMSYCYLTSVGVNFNDGFGTQPTNVIRNSISASGCLLACGVVCNNNGVQDGDETGIDCGGTTCPPCVSCSNGIMDGDETGIDCGGTTCPPCVSCSNGVMDGDETGIDCGGTTCPPCVSCSNGIMDGNETGIDCGGRFCPPCTSCNNGIQDGDETGVDCGGSICPPCPSCSNGIQDGDETGVDCGGSDCPPCESTCPAPTGTLAKEIKGKDAKLKWNPVPGALIYIVIIRKVGDISWLSFTTPNTEIKVKSLKKGKTYEWQVRSVCDGAASPFSSLCTFKAGDKSSSSCSASSAITGAGDIFKAYPNPTNGQLKIELPQNGNAYRIEVLDLYGRRIMSQNEIISSTSLDLSLTKNGFYVIRIYRGNEVRWTEKIIVRH